MRVLTEREIEEVSGGARPQANPQQGLGTAYEQQGFPFEGKVWNGTQGTNIADEKTELSPQVGGGKEATATSTP